MHDNRTAVDYLKVLGVIWRYDEGSPVHAELTPTSGSRHSDFFCNMSKLIERPEKLELVCNTLLRCMPIKKPVRFVGQAQGSITIAYELARQTGNLTAFTEKAGNKMILSRFEPRPDEEVVIVEDVTTTGATTLASIAACEEAGMHVFPVVFTVVNRSQREHLMGHGTSMYGLLPFAKASGTEWEADDCPLCRSGSVAKRPKLHWQEFSG